MSLPELIADLPPLDLEVRDRGNPERLLGLFDGRALPSIGGERLRVAVPAPVSYEMLRSSWMAPALITAEFDVHYRPTPCGRARAAELRTSTPLDQLLSLREFRLPKETRAAAKERLYRRLYGG